MNTSRKLNGWLDLILFTGFILAFFLNLTGVFLHEIIGIAAGLMAAYHLLIHGNWVSAVTRRFFGKTPGKLRLYYLIDAGLLAGFFTIIFSGMVIAGWISLPLIGTRAWHTLHVTASIATLLVTSFKLALHWRWIASTARSIFTRPALPLSQPQAARPRVAAQAVSRREFLKVAGVAGAASVLALGTSIHSLQSAQAAQSAASSSSQASSSQTGTVNPLAAGSEASDSASCSVRCPRGCSFPGHCRRYTDSNQNNRCDLGECI